MGKEKASVTLADSPWERGAQLNELFAFASELNEVEEELRHSFLSKKQPDARAAARNSELVAEIKSRTVLLKTSFSMPELVGPALRVCDKLLTTMPFGDHNMTVLLTEQSEGICDGLRDYPEYFELGLQLLSEAHNLHLASETNTVKHRASARRIRTAVTRILPDFELYFSEANEASDEDLKKRTTLLRELVSIVSTHRKLNWLPEVVIKHITRVLNGENYVPDNFNRFLSGDISLRKYLKAERRKGDEGIPQEAVTRFELSTLLGAIRNKEMLAHVVRGVTQSLGLRSEDYVQPASGATSERPADSLHAPLERILDQIDDVVTLERVEPGCTQVLRSVDGGGIRWYSRYPLERLLKLSREHKDTSKPFVLFMSAVADSNGAFFNESDRAVVESVAAQCEQLGYAFRLIECDSKKEMRSQFTALQTLYQGRHKISGLIIRAHAWRWNLWLGDDEDDGDIHYQDLDDQAFLEDINYFEESAPILIDGCSVGRGIGQKMSRTFDTVLKAAKSLTSALVRVTISKQGTNILFDPEYEIHDGKVEKGDTGPHVFNRGRRL
jgi:hypothetical protein